MDAFFKNSYYGEKAIVREEKSNLKALFNNFLQKSNLLLQLGNTRLIKFFLSGCEATSIDMVLNLASALGFYNVEKQKMFIKIAQHILVYTQCLSYFLNGLFVYCLHTLFDSMVSRLAHSKPGGYGRLLETFQEPYFTHVLIKGHDS